jgi:phytoene dehydrogenase-like protein
MEGARLHSKEPQVAVVGSGPNGLAAALELQRSGARVQFFERAEVVGGCVRTEEITFPGFRTPNEKLFYALLRRLREEEFTACADITRHKQSSRLFEFETRLLCANTST